jgi:hypothetical protein
MMKTFTAALVMVVAGGMALAPSGAGKARLAHAPGAERAARAIDTYRGPFKEAGPNTKIRIKVKARAGEAKKIRSLRYRRLPASCDSGDRRIRLDIWRFVGFKVDHRRRFSIAGTARDGSSIDFTGRFSRNFNRVRGRLESTIVYSDPDETCTVPGKRYTARR